MQSKNNLRKVGMVWLECTYVHLFILFYFLEKGRSII